MIITAAILLGLFLLGAAAGGTPTRRRIVLPAPPRGSSQPSRGVVTIDSSALQIAVPGGRSVELTGAAIAAGREPAALEFRWAIDRAGKVRGAGGARTSHGDRDVPDYVPMAKPSATRTGEGWLVTLTFPSLYLSCSGDESKGWQVRRSCDQAERSWYAAPNEDRASNGRSATEYQRKHWRIKRRGRVATPWRGELRWQIS